MPGIRKKGHYILFVSKPGEHFKLIIAGRVAIMNPEYGTQAKGTGDKR